MALTQQEIQEMEQVTGLKYSAPSQTSSIGKSRADEIRARAAKSTKPSFMDALAGKAQVDPDLARAQGVDVARSGAEHITESVKHPVETAKGVIKGVPRAAAGLVELADTGISKVTGQDGTMLDYDPIKELTAPSNTAQETGVVVGGMLPVERAVSAVAPVVKSLSTVYKTGKALGGASKNVDKVTDLINPSEDLMTVTQRKMASDEGRQTITKKRFGADENTFTPSEETQRAARILSEDLSGSETPDIVVKAVKNKISQRGAEAEEYLKSNPKLLPEKIRSAYFDQMTNNAKKNLTETEFKHYQEQIDLFKRQLEDQPGNTYGLYKGLKQWESDIAATLPKGKDAIIDPTGVANAKIRAAADIRKNVRDIIGEQNSEFKEQMYDLMSLYNAKDDALQIASKFKGGKGFFEKHPKTTKVLKGAAYVGGIGTLGGGAIDIMK